MSKKNKGKSQKAGKSAPAARSLHPSLVKLYQAVEGGDSRQVRALADEIVANEDLADEVHRVAMSVRKGVAMDRATLAFVAGGLVLWALLLVLGVLLRQ